ncbi:NACHT domain and WD40 repeat protein [Psychromonas sp. CNPT3]|uniref:ATP-binding protein n=1 Tax=Psychromonas sp. CNPT3 TaxID=314282 RepID=UPI00006E38F8|nr:ATP-binding protein [Psychromonas sp. CNPT3]AGH82245.1 NACHT domain and WD40 repeat protein [Psychromonas sp. CNPT3]
MNSKTFRLFISSTFSDFKREREVLQSNVFPHIKNYAAQQGYTFQPIDLRWGVSNEAQLDQKTLELCLDEVKACKTYKHPNFLVMLGDRYGWIPLPYAIEAQEFEMLCVLMTEQEKQNLANWYLKDLNQLPASYILQERTGDFEAFECWEKEERKLRQILQNVANSSTLSRDQKNKYFTSATEAEVNEGIISYLKPTDSQKKLKIRPEIDAEHVFGFFRKIDPNSKVAETFIADDADQGNAKDFSDRVSVLLRPENRLHREVKQVEKNKLDESYLQDFQERVTQFLESKIDEQKKTESKQPLPPLKIEQKEQKYFASNKRKFFLGQEEPLQKIADYISDDNQKPLVIYGKSGSGKSALIAKAIELAELNSPKKVVYRFVGATANSSSWSKLLTSIFSELKQLSDSNTLFSLDENEEAFKQIPHVLYNFNLIKSDVVIFIDAIDQLINHDDFEWLPKQLPTNIKVVISVLKDDIYPKENLAYETLRGKSSTLNFTKMPEFESGTQLLLELLRWEKRTIQEDQLKYIESQLKSTRTPLYAYMLAQKVKHLKSIDSAPEQEVITTSQLTHLKSIQQKSVKAYIDSLSTVYHHEASFINRVLGYLFASRDGLSENQLLELINTDKTFIKSVASEQYHQNTTSELPLIHWSRLISKLKPFLSRKKVNDQSVMFFSQREFSELCKLSLVAKVEHESIITAIQVLISTNSKNSKILSSWEKLYLKVSMNHYTLYQDDEILSLFMNFLASQGGKRAHDLKTIKSSSELNKVDAIAFAKCNFYYTKHFYLLDKAEHFNRNGYMMALKELSISFKKYGEESKALAFDHKAYEMAMDAYKKYNQSPKDYLGYGNNLAASYIRLNQLEGAETILSDIWAIIKELFYGEWNMPNDLILCDWKDLYIVIANNLATYFNKISDYTQAQILLIEVIDLTERLIDSDPETYVSRYVSSLTTLSDIYIHHESDGINKALEILTKVSVVLDKYVNFNENLLVDEFIKNCLELAYVQEFQHDFESALSNLDKVKPVLTQIMQKDESKALDSKYLDYLVLSYKVNFHLQSAEAEQLKDEVFNFVETKNLQGEQVTRYLNEINSMLPKANNAGQEGFIRITNAEMNARNSQLKVIFFCDFEQENRITSHAKEILTNCDFTDDTPYEIVTIYNDKELSFAEMIIESKLELPSLVYFFDGSVEFIRSIENISTTNIKATLEHWLDLSVYVADNENSNQVDFKHFLNALSYIELDTKWKNFFDQLFETDTGKLPFKTNSESCIEYAKSISDIGITTDCHNFLLDFSKLLNDESMGHLR